MDPTRRWKLTGTNDDTLQQALRFPTGGVFAATGNPAAHEHSTDRHQGIEREILATLDNLKSGLDEITALLDDSIPFPGGFFDTDRPSAA